MTLAQLGLCAGSIYACFLAWGLLQERLTTTAYPIPHDSTYKDQLSASLHGQSLEYFQSPLLLNWTQAIACSIVAVAYLVAGNSRSTASKGKSIWRVLGLDVLSVSGAERAQKPAFTSASQVRPDGLSTTRRRISPLFVRYLAIAAFQSTASQLGLLSLSHGISYPTLTLAKSCKLLPVLIANVVIYRRKFAPYKYAVVLLVTAGISAFMLAAPSKKKSSSGGDTLFGMGLLIANLALDGATNSTQDDVFSKWSIAGPQMMLLMNLLSSILMGFSLILPLPGVGSSSSSQGSNELSSALAFIHRHPQVVKDLAGYALAGAFGQIAIFETLERFGSLTLVSITVTRKLFTMLLSIAVYGHKLNPTQWIGVAVVFFGLGIEAREKRREGLQKQKAKEEVERKAKQVKSK
ncbi:uaa transporter [Ceraceosorus bombacis]|uniref:UDP-galactose transporter homolog 1 n=1 Tax=Ceraceosorus bombacis TaxID=401625 RepID=A0A0P1B971_9BASI|nr:uaa transporter [Ceraceosorus bombacis]